MWTLTNALTRLRDRLAEESSVFWDADDLTAYVNDAQRFIASVTRGVEAEVTHEVSRTDPVIPLPARVTNAHPSAAYVVGGRVLNVVPIATANMIDVNWRARVAATPLWVVPHFTNREAYVSPRPSQPMDITLTVAVLPNDVAAGSDALFNGQEMMAKYLNSFLNLSASYALLKERYDQDAERFYNLAVQELAQLGVVPEEIPPFKQVRDEQLES